MLLNWELHFFTTEFCPEKSGCLTIAATLFGLLSMCRQIVATCRFSTALAFCHQPKLVNASESVPKQPHTWILPVETKGSFQFTELPPMRNEPKYQSRLGKPTFNYQTMRAISHLMIKVISSEWLWQTKIKLCVFFGVLPGFTYGLYSISMEALKCWWKERV